MLSLHTLFMLNRTSRTPWTHLLFTSIQPKHIVCTSHQQRSNHIPWTTSIHESLSNYTPIEPYRWSAEISLLLRAALWILKSTSVGILACLSFKNPDDGVGQLGGLRSTRSDLRMPGFLDEYDWQVCSQPHSHFLNCLRWYSRIDVSGQQGLRTAGGGIRSECGQGEVAVDSMRFRVGLAGQTP